MTVRIGNGQSLANVQNGTVGRLRECENGAVSDRRSKGDCWLAMWIVSNLILQSIKKITENSERETGR